MLSETKTTAAPSKAKPFVPGVHAAPPSTWLVNAVKASPFIALHLLALFVFWTPFTAAAGWLLLATFALRTFGITAGYHRYFAHKAYKTSRVFQFVLAWLGCSAVQKGPLWWAGHHRGHHRHSDTPADPHSPHETSFWWAHVGWIMSNEYSKTPDDDIPDFARYPELRFLDAFHWVPGIVLAVASYLIAGMPGLVWGFLVSTLIVYHCTFCVNSINHLFGSRRYATPDDSRNNWVVALLTFGEGWHNNHHHYQSSANQGFYWWEIDISYSALVVLSWFGIVWDLRRPGDKALHHRRVKPVPAPRSLAEMEAAARK
ncbi:MAG: acyl-CoA desaturase [Gemmataceae bacterium]|nr:acyl-CoA desaturase [Gemmataceae bacterium]